MCLITSESPWFLTFHHKAMWLSNDSSGLSGKAYKCQPKAYSKHRSTSPPLEGGESLCEFYSDRKEESSSDCLQNGSSSKHCNQLEILKDPNSEFEDDVASCQKEENFPNRKLVSLLGKEPAQASTFTQTFLQSILSSVNSHDPVVANAWMETLLDVMDLLPKNIVKDEILTLAVNKGQLSQPVSSRLLCCKMLSKICTMFDPYIIKKEVLPVVLSLCQDVDFEVRACMCRQLDMVAKGVGLEQTKSAILPELVELSNDEDSSVRLAGIETVVRMLPLLDDESCIQAIIPLVKKVCQNSLRSQDITLVTVSKQLGRLCHGLAMNFTPDQKLWFLQFFRNVAKLGLPHHKKDKSEPDFSPVCSMMPDLVPEVDNKDRFRECRYSCAYNFPALVLFTGPENFEKELYETFSELCSDPFQNVRKTVACGFYEVTKMLNEKSIILLPELIHMLKDESLEVLKGIISYLPETLKIMCCEIKDSEKKNNQIQELVNALKTCEETTSVTSNWRLYADFLAKLSCLSSCLSPDVIYTTFVPLLFVKIHTVRPIPCRVASAYSLLIFLRNTPKLEQRNGIINELIIDLCYGRSCHKRMLFIKVCEVVMDIFSKAFFKKHFYKPLLSLSGDPVPNIRLRLCAIMPKLKSLLKLPKDSSLLQSLEGCVRKLMTDEKDKDVSAAVSKAIQELDKIEVTHEPSSRRTSFIELEADLEDMRKEEEEKQMLKKELEKKHSKENENSSSPAASRSLPRKGKIPVRKSGTLPKQSASKEFKTSTLIRTAPSSPCIVKSVRQAKRSTRPVSCFEPLRSSKDDLLDARYKAKELHASLPQMNLTLRLENPLSQKHTSRFVSPSSAHRKPLDRCPSPMPLPRRSHEITSSGQVSQQTQVNLSNFHTSNQLRSSPQGYQAFEEKVKEKLLSLQVDSKNSSANTEKIRISSNNRKQISYPGTPIPSPEVFRRAQANATSAGSKIPTSSSVLKRRSTINE